MLPTYFFSSDPIDKGCQCWRPHMPNCGQLDRTMKRDHFETDIDDIANSLMKVMCICRLPPWAVKRTKEPIKRSFRHYEQQRYKVNRVPAKRFNKENFIHDLAVEAGMSRMDSQLAYSITKRAFRAYYHGTGEDGLRLASYAEQMRHRSDCLWLHAAKRTAEIFAVFAGLMYSEQQQYEECIECVYKALYEELQTRLRYEDPNTDCVCGLPAASQPSGTEKKVNRGADAVSMYTNMSGATMVTTEIFFNKQMIAISKPTSDMSIHMAYKRIEVKAIVSTSERSVKSKRTVKSSEQSGKSASSKRPPRKRKHKKCNCPNMQCVQERTPVITAECSQGPYVCRWVPFDEEESFREHRVPCPPMHVICQPCHHDELPCDDECTCTCEFCRCPSAYDDYEEEEQHVEQLSGSGLEDQDTDFCWLGPFRDFPKAEHKEPTEPRVEEEVDPAACGCMCEYKKRSQPHLFTYLAPFKSEVAMAVAAAPPAVEKVKPKVLPCGISLATYRCWNDPVNPDEKHSEPNCRECPYIALLSAVSNPQQPKVAGISMDVTVKTQHYPSPDKSQPSKGQSRSSVIVKRNTIAALENDMKAIQNQKPNQPPRSTTTAATGVRASVPATVPKANPAPAPVPAPAKVESDEKLTKEDVLEMFGLNK